MIVAHHAGEQLLVAALAGAAGVPLLAVALRTQAAEFLRRLWRH